jgi:signal transduction histidine kinase
VLVVVGIVIFVGHNSRGSATTLLAPGAVAVALLVVAGPWAYRTARDRARAEERAELAARVHDSVLQTLTLIQKDPSDARRLARRQERELRSWLYPATSSGTLADVLAAREAMANAARHAGVDEVSVFVEPAAVYVRDRGAGFDPEAVASDRRGLAESIRGRMERVGGSARIVTSPGEGTEVELHLS